jgi:hypothetical protein
MGGAEGSGRIHQLGLWSADVSSCMFDKGYVTIHVVVQALSQSALRPLRKFIRRLALTRQGGTATSRWCCWPCSSSCWQTGCCSTRSPRHGLWCCNHRSWCLRLAARSNSRPWTCRTRRRRCRDLACEISIPCASCRHRYGVRFLGDRCRRTLFARLFLLLDLSKSLLGVYG